jgi:hypothetical protein
MPEALGAAASGAGIRIIPAARWDYSDLGPREPPLSSGSASESYPPGALSGKVYTALVNSRLPCRVARELGWKYGLAKHRMGDVLEALGV